MGYFQDMLARNKTAKPSGSVTYKGSSYPQDPDISDMAKESLMTTDDRAQIEALRKARQRAAENNVNG